MPFRLHAHDCAISEQPAGCWYKSPLHKQNDVAYDVRTVNELQLFPLYMIEDVYIKLLVFQLENNA